MQAESGRGHDIFSVMTVPPEEIPPAVAEAVARDHWGVRGSAVLLTGERDRNFRLTPDGAAEPAFVVKFANPVEDPAVTDFQIKALQYVARMDPGFPVPRVIPLPDGTIEAKVETAKGVQRVRLLSWLPGVPLGGSPRTVAQREACGRELARLGLALEGFEHPASRHELIWDVTHVLRLREVLDALEDPASEDAVAVALDAFESGAKPVLSGLRHQVVYNDMNSGNTLMRPDNTDELAGIIDFGDLVETALAIDVAVGAVAQIAPDIAMIEAIAVFVAAFHRVRPLTREEVEVLPLLLAARACMGVVLPAWHLRTHPGNPHYQKVDRAELARRIAIIQSARSPEMSQALRSACNP